MKTRVVSSLFAIFISFVSYSALATNPLVLTEAADKVTDIVILSSSIGDLAEEIGVSAELLQELNSVREEARMVEDQIYLTKTISEEVYGLSNPKIGGTKKLAYDIDSVTRYVRRAKNLGSMILRLGGRPEAATAATLQATNGLLLAMLQNQERASLAHERELVSKKRTGLSGKIAYAQFITEEQKRINEHAADSVARHRVPSRHSLLKRARQ